MATYIPGKYCFSEYITEDLTAGTNPKQVTLWKIKSLELRFKKILYVV